MDTKSVINAIIASYFEPYEIAITTGTNITSVMIVLCVRDNWIYGAQAIVDKCPINTLTIIASIRNKNTAMFTLLISKPFTTFDDLNIIYELAANDNPLLLNCRFWKIDRNNINQAIAGAASVNNVTLMQKIYDIAIANHIKYVPWAMDVIRLEHLEALQKMLEWGANILRAQEHSVIFNQPECLQVIYDFNPKSIDFAYCTKYAIVENSYAVLILLKKLHDMDLRIAFAYAVEYNRLDCMRMIHNWGGSYDAPTDKYTAYTTLELLNEFKD